MSEELNSKRISLFPALPAVVNQVLESLSSRSVNDYEIIGTIESEPGMSAALLGMINHGLFGEVKLNSLSELIDMLGLPRLRFALLAYGFSRFCNENYANFGHTSGLSAKITWEHAISVAYFGVEIAKIIKYPRLEEVLLAGLIHDVGRQIIMINRPEEYSELLGSVYGVVVDIVAHERTKIGLSHDQVGAMLVGHWQLPESIASVIEFHHNCEAAEDHQILVHIITLANQLAVSQGTSFELCDEVDKDSNVSVHLLELSGDDIDELVKNFHQNAITFRKAFSF